MTDAPGSYFVVSRGGKDFVMYARDDAPALWRMIARFEDHDRAVDYAETENGALKYYPDYPDDDIAEAIPDIDAPPSAITPANLTPREICKTTEDYSDPVPASEPVEKINTAPEPEETRPETEREALDRALAPVVEKLEAARAGEAAVDGLQPISGAARLYYEYLCGVADRGERLPANILATAGPSGVRRGSIHYAKGTLEMRGYISPLTMPEGAWGYRLLDGRTVESGHADTAAGPGKHPNSRGNNTISDAAAEKIDEKLQAGESIRKIAKDVGVSKNSVQLRKRKPTTPVERGIMDESFGDDAPAPAASDDDKPVKVLTKEQIRARLAPRSTPVTVPVRDPEPKRAAAAEAEPANMTECLQYLRDAGHEVITMGTARYALDGAEVTQMQLLSAANNERVRHGLRPMAIPMVDPPSSGGSSLRQALSGGPF